MSFHEIADEAFTDLLRTHDRPVDLKDALKRSVKERPHAGEDKPADATRGDGTAEDVCVA